MSSGFFSFTKLTHSRLLSPLLNPLLRRGQSVSCCNRLIETTVFCRCFRLVPLHSIIHTVVDSFRYVETISLLFYLLICFLWEECRLKQARFRTPYGVRDLSFITLACKTTSWWISCPPWLAFSCLFSKVGYLEMIAYMRLFTPF